MDRKPQRNPEEIVPASYREQILDVVQGSSFRAGLLRGSLGSIAIKVGNIALGLLLSVVLARSLGADGYGTYAFALAIVSLLAVPAQVGIPQVVVRETAAAKSVQAWGSVLGLWRWAAQAVGLFSTVVLVGGLAVVWISPVVTDPTRRATILLALPLVPLIALANLRGAALRGLGRVVLGQVPESILRPALLIAVIGVGTLLVPSGELTPEFAMAGNVGAVGVAFLSGTWLLWKIRPDSVKATSATQYKKRYWWRAAWPMALAGGLHLVNSQLDIVVLGLFRSSSEVGVYRVAVQGASFVGFGMAAVNQVMMPHFSHLHASGQEQRLESLVIRSAQAMFAIAIVPVVVFLLFGGTLLATVFGEAFSTGKTALVTLSIGQLISAGIGSVGLLLNMTGNERESLRGVAYAAVGNLILNFVLVPPLGLFGAAASTAITLTLSNILFARAVRSNLGIASGILASPRAARK